ncbi:PPOX class F420-dependent oxidoreductase [soil metagenome]
MTTETGSKAALLALGEQPFVSLTTFRKTGVPVSTPVWIARYGNFITITTPAESGKVKRLRNNARVELRPCDRMGKVKPGVRPVEGLAEILADDGSVERISAVFARKYRLEYRIFMLIERLGKSGRKPRVILRITTP